MMLGTATQECTDEVFAHLFRTQLGEEAPAVRLCDIVHWRMVIEALGLASLPLNQQRAYVASGYFYLMHTPDPSDAHVSASMRAAAAERACVLYPAIRRGAGRRLRDCGSIPVPWFFESEYVVRRGVEQDLRAQLGGRRLRALRRIERRCEEGYDTHLWRGEELLYQPQLIASFDRLHWINLAKYGHRHSQYSAAALEILLRTDVGERTVLLVRTPRGGGEPVQALLGFLSPDRRTLALPVHGIDHDQVPRTQNLYTAALLWFYRWGIGNGVETFNLGRGAPQLKLDLGANAFYRLDNHLIEVGSSTLPGLHLLRDMAVAHMTRASAQLVATIERRGVARLVKTA